MGRPRLLLACLAVAVLPTRTLGFPLTSGTSWEYGRDDGDDYVLEVVGTETVLGQLTMLVRGTHTAGRQAGGTFEQFWTFSADGDFLWHGSRGESGVAAYGPPVTVLRVPYEVGESWEVTTQRYCDLEGTVPYGEPDTQTVEVLGVGAIEVPAGQFSCVHLTTPVYGACPFGLVSPLMPLGSAAPRGTVATIWIDESVGIVRSEITGGPVTELTAFHPVQTSVEPTSWGRVKAFYR